jgi:hypothetical protein
VSSPLPPPRAPPPTPQPAELPTGQRSSRSERRPQPTPQRRLRRRHVGVGRFFVVGSGNLPSGPRHEAGQRQHGHGEGQLAPVEVVAGGGGDDGGGGGFGRLFGQGSEDPDLVEDILLQSKRDGLRNERVYGQQAT